MTERRAAALSLSELWDLLRLLILSGILAVFALSAGQRMVPLLLTSAPQKDGEARISRRVISYRLDPGRATVFRFSQPIHQVRLITLPIIAPGQAMPGQGWTYGIRAELLDASGRGIVTRQLYTFSFLFAKDGSHRGPWQFYRGRNELVGLSNEVRLSSATPFSGMRLLTGTTDRGVIGVDARVYERRPIIASAAQSAFVRLSPGERKRLSRSNAFPADMLTSQERINISVNQWRPVGPAGIDGRDYNMGVLYENEDEVSGGTGSENRKEAGG
jgi:hypothetical protein